MDRNTKSKLDRQTIYEIYRGCRLCGAGAGYKMPIIQTVVDLDGNGMELKQKIQECVQIEINPDDKMPPLICELCVDKVNDFYQFMEMCKQTNIHTRLRLGLPLQKPANKIALQVENNSRVSRASQTTFKMTRPSKPSPSPPPSRSRREDEMTLSSLKKENSRESRSSETIEKQPIRTTRNSKAASPPPSTPRIRSQREENMTLSNLKQQVQKDSKSKDSKPSKDNKANKDKAKDSKVTKVVKTYKDSKAAPKSILKKREELMDDEDSLLVPRNKRSRDVDVIKLEVPVKKVKISLPSSKQKQAAHPARPKRAPPSPAPPPPPAPPQYSCAVCGDTFRSSQGVSAHMKVHVVSFTDPKLACDPCCAWFSTAEEAATHQKRHSASLRYTCRRCSSKYKTIYSYNEHLEYKKCLQFDVVPDLKCARCGQSFATKNLHRRHRCHGTFNRSTTCTRCGRVYASPKTLKLHVTTCYSKKKDEIKVDPEVQRSLLPAQIRVSRCDSLLVKNAAGHYDVADVDLDYGLDDSCVYPYRVYLRIKTEPLYQDRMVAIVEEVRNELCSEEYIHWDSDTCDSDSDSTNNSKKEVDMLSTLSLKTLFSLKLLGKVPRKRRRIKMEKCDESVGVSVNKNDSVGYDTEDSVDSFSIIDSLLTDIGQNKDNVNESTVNNDKVSNDVGTNNVNNDLELNKTSNKKSNTSENYDVSKSNEARNNLPVNNRTDNSNVMELSDSSSSTRPVNKEIDNVEFDNDDTTSGNNTINENNVLIISNNQESIDPECSTNNSLTTSKEVTSDVTQENVKNNSNIDNEASKENRNSEILVPVIPEEENRTENKDLDSTDLNNKSNENIVGDKSTNKENGTNLNTYVKSINDPIPNKVKDKKERNENETNNVSPMNNIYCNNYEHDNSNIEKSNGESNKPVDGDIESKSSDTELDDMKLMEALDQQIGEYCNDSDESHKNTDGNNEINSNKDCNSEINENSNKNDRANRENNVDKDNRYNRNKITNNEKKLDLDSKSKIELTNGESSKEIDWDKSKESNDTAVEDMKLMDALDMQIGENSNSHDESHNSKVHLNDSASENNDNKTPNAYIEEDSVADKDKITLEDLVPKDDLKSLELDNVSDDDFDFDL
ncbi:uncharacterized protein LOC131845265 [Achroia grisella]|uniref:uncharacterized protein LOC131845265 n=1 Tax=Achroia grisella TaxID=688607 RepID=UPI0027D28C89|nr:uncharacterized protein LOC131845265 [Achroia grisella]